MDIKQMLRIGDLEVFEKFGERAAALNRGCTTDNENFLVVHGDTTALWLVAHIDTVCRHRGNEKKICEHQGCLVAKDRSGKRTVLGADDRAGCFALWSFIEDTRINLLLTNYEETGGRGVRCFLENEELYHGAKLFIEFDRKGVNTYVQYNRNPPELHAWLKKFNLFNDGYGTFSDIALISAKSKVPSFNMGIGYDLQHSEREFLDIAAMNMAIEKTRFIVADFLAKNLDFGTILSDQARPTRTDWSNVKKIDIKTPASSEGWIMDSESREVMCEICGANFREGHRRICQHYKDESQLGLIAV